MSGRIPEFVRVIIRDDAGRFLVLAEKRTPVLWNFPGGKVDTGETPQEAANREVREEVGLVISDLRLLESGEFQVRGQTWLGHFFHGVSVEGTASVQEPDKCAGLRYVSMEELCKLPSIPRLLVEPARVLLANQNQGGHGHGQ